MFQNISANTEYVDESKIKIEKLKENFIKQNFSKQSILNLYISIYGIKVQFGNDLAPFAIAIIAAMLANNIPILIPYI